MVELTEILEEPSLKETVATKVAIPPLAVATEETESVEITEPEGIIDALARCGLFSKETELIPNIVAFDDNIFNEEYYRKKHGKSFPDSWYAIMAKVSKQKFEDLRNNARQMERLAAKVVTWE
jgi:hypothetical protein